MSFIKINTKALHTISPYLYMQFMEPLGNADSSVDAAWDYVSDDWRPEVLDLIKYLAPPMIRWGGCLASYYHWREGIGSASERVPMLNLCWDGLYSNHVGTAELVKFCQTIKSELLLTVNMESDGRMQWAYPKQGVDRFGTLDEAYEWIDYCNNPNNTLRKSNGFEEPFHVKYWQIGNETSYDPNGFSCEQAVPITRKFAERMREADPTIKLIAWGDNGWAKHMSDQCGDIVDYVSFHHHFDSGLPNSPLFGTEYRRDYDRTWHHLMHAHKSLQAHIDEMREQVKSTSVRLTMTEGHFSLRGRNRCELLSSWAAGVAYARCIHVLERNSDIIDIATMADFFGNRWQVNALMIPTPFRKKAVPYLQPVGEVMALYEKYKGDTAVSVEGPPDLDMTGSRKGNTLFLHVANTTLNRSIKASFQIEGKKIINGKVHEIAVDPDFEITELEPHALRPVSFSIKDDSWTFSPASVSVVVLQLEDEL